MSKAHMTANNKPPMSISRRIFFLRVATGIVIWIVCSIALIDISAGHASWVSICVICILWPLTGLISKINPHNRYHIREVFLYIDAVLLGYLVAITHFLLLPLLIMTNILFMGQCIAFGLKGIVTSVFASALGVALGIHFFGFYFSPYIQPYQIGMLIVLLAICTAHHSVITNNIMKQLALRKKKFETLSQIDGLSALYNRRYWQEHLMRIFESTRKNEEQSCLMLVDVDHFKTINDKLGHTAGDSVIAELGALIKKCIREHDIPGRYGGEEFAIILPRTDIDEARQLAERIKQHVETKRFTHCQTISIHVSIGVAPLGLQLQDYNQWIANADVALYEAKRSGRNRVAVYTHSAA